MRVAQSAELGQVGPSPVQRRFLLGRPPPDTIQPRLDRNPAQRQPEDVL